MAEPCAAPESRGGALRFSEAPAAVAGLQLVAKLLFLKEFGLAYGNKGLAGFVIEGQGASPEPRRPPKTGFLAARETRLSDLAGGSVTTRQHEAVDPASCRIWDGHNRDYQALNETACVDLIESLRAQGRQEIPAIVRRIQGDPSHRFEVICGARRHWSVTWLRAHDYPDFKFVVEPREMTDEEAFRVADLENRSRKDLSDYERATDYARAVERYYGGNQQRMVERLQVTKSWLSRYLELSKLPNEVLACFENCHVIGISHAAALAPRLAHPLGRAALLKQAEAIAQEQSHLRESSSPALKPAQVVSRLLHADKRPRLEKGARWSDLRDGEGGLIATVEDKGRGGVAFTVPVERIQDDKAVSRAIGQHLAALRRNR